MEQKRKGKFYLKWPWNVVVYIVLLVCLRLLAIPVILLLAFWNKKQQPDGPEEGYCLQRTRMRLARLGWAALFLALGGLLGAYFVGCILIEDMQSWGAKDYGIWVVSALAGLFFLGMGLVEAYRDLRDALCPARSTLAKSIRSQLPYPDEAPDVKELFAMVDEDIKANGQWFDRVAVGKRWVLGDQAADLSRVRVVCGRDEMIRHHSNGRVRSSRVLELYLLDDRRQLQMTYLRSGSELPMLLECLRLRAPEARFCSYKELSAYQNMSEQEWQALEQEYQQRRNQRVGQQQSQSQGSKSMVLVDVQGQRSSLVDLGRVKQQLGQLTEYGMHFSIELLEPIPAGQLGQLTLLGAGQVNTGLTLTAVFRQPDGTYLGWGQPVTEEEAAAVFGRLLWEGRAPDVSDWQPLQAAEEPQQSQRPQLRLILRERNGARREYTSFTRRDVELAGDGIASGKYREAVLMASPFYIQLQAGDQTDGQVVVCVSEPGPEEIRLYETKCSDQQARQWLLDFAEGRFQYNFAGWEDITKQVQQKKK